MEQLISIPLNSLTLQNSVVASKVTLQKAPWPTLTPTPPQELLGRVLIDLGQNHAKDSASNLTIYMTD